MNIIQMFPHQFKTLTSDEYGTSPVQRFGDKVLFPTAFVCSSYVSTLRPSIPVLSVP